MRQFQRRFVLYIIVGYTTTITTTMPIYHDDNFGTWNDMDDPEMVSFYHQCQRTNVTKKCQGCQEMVNIQPHYAYCNSCADKIERGMEF